MGDNQTTSTVNTGSSDPMVKSTLDQILGGVQAAATKGPQVNPVSLYGGVGPTTSNAWASSLAASGNPDYTSGVKGALASYAPVAAGADLGQNDPGYAALRAKLGNDTLTSVNQSFNNSGRLGGGSNVKTATDELTNALGGLDYQQYQDSLTRQNNAAAQLPNLYSALQAPSATAGAVGSAQDANTQATLLANNDLFNRQANGSTDLLSKLSSILGVAAPTAGTTSSTSQPTTPWWQTVLGLGATAAGLASR